MSAHGANNATPKVWCGSRGFRSKKEREAFVRAALDAVPFGDVPRFAPLHALIEDVLDLHPRVEEKRSGGIAHFRVMPSNGGRETQIVRPDGSVEIFSWLKCLGMVSDRQEIMSAYREAVDDQIAPLRHPGMHVDHVAPWTFARIVADFEQQHGVATMQEIDFSALLRSSRFASARRELFAEHHRRLAVLEVVTPRVNYDRARRQSECSTDWDRAIQRGRHE